MEILQDFFEKWVEEFSRAVEMFTGEKPELSLSGPPTDLNQDFISNRTWWKQLAHGESPFSLWAGAQEPLWTALGEGEAAQSSFFEMLSQANQGTAAVLSTKLPIPLRFEEGATEAPILPLELKSVQIKVSFRGAEAGTIDLLMEEKALRILDQDFDLSTASLSGNSAPAASPAMLARLMDLQLPVSVMLGHANITIREALKLTSGSVVELDRQVGDHVEIMVHGTVVAKGEIVSVKGNYGVRIKQIISRQERIALHEAA